MSPALDTLVPEGKTKPQAGEPHHGTWLDVLPCTGIVTDRLGRERGGYRFSIVERSPAVAEFVASRTRPKAEVYGWPQLPGQLEQVPSAGYDVVSCFFRLEDLAKSDRTALLDSFAQWVRPGGVLLIGIVNKNSYHDFTEKLRSRGRGPKGVEYVLSPDPNIGPFQSLEIREVVQPCESKGLRPRSSLGATSATERRGDRIPNTELQCEKARVREIRWQRCATLGTASRRNLESGPFSVSEVPETHVAQRLNR